MEPIISIIVPVYNVEKYLNRCMESLLNQSYKKIEIILVNDGSTDRSGNICNTYKNNYKNVKVLHHKCNSGSAGSSRNSGLKIASGDYISFIDSDDWIHPDMMKSMLTAILKNNSKIAECDLIESDSYFIKPLNSTDIENTTLENRLSALKRIISNQRFSVCIRLYEYSVIKKIRFPENVISEDVYFTLEVFNKINELVRIQAPFYYYYITPNSVTRKAYSLKYFDSLNSGLHLQKSIQKTENDQELLTIVQHHILKKIMYHYKMLNYYPEVDPKYVHRKRLKKLIDKNYYNNQAHDSYIKLAKLLSVKSFEVLIDLNKLRHKVFRKNQFL